MSASSPIMLLIDGAVRALSNLAAMFTALLLSPGSIFSLSSLLMALAVSVGFLILRRKRHRVLRLRALWRAMFPGHIWRHASTRADIGYLLLNTLVTTTLIGWGLFSMDAICSGTTAVFVHLFGAPPAAILPSWASGAILTVGLFIAFDFAYWFDHYLMHRVSWLWEFHRVHHTAEVLTPLTVFRVHPVDSLIYANIRALIIGIVQGALGYGLGSTHPMLVYGTNIILVFFLHMTVHLQHSHIRLAFTGIWGHLLFSPAHHHIHHSDDTRHYNTNFGGHLAIWDSMFGTLIVPEPKQRLSFGTGPAPEGPHSATGGLIHPFIQAMRILARPFRRLTGRPAKPHPQPAEIA